MTDFFPSCYSVVWIKWKTAFHERHNPQGGSHRRFPSLCPLRSRPAFKPRWGHSPLRYSCVGKEGVGRGAIQST